MQYQGGKSRIAKRISEVITNEISRWKEPNSRLNCVSNQESNNFVSLFCGSCAVEVKLADSFSQVICNDNHKYLIALYKALQNGYEPPDYVDEEEYKYVRSHIQDERPEYVGFVGFGSSFGGKWFGGYGKSKKPNGEIRWHSEETKRALKRDMKYLKDVKFTCLDYKDVIIPKGSVVYADPPYNGTTGYNSEKFNTEEFWEYMRKISKDNMVFISELNAPDDFKCIWERPFTRTLDRNKNNQFKVVEKLFIHNE